jgi:hypothetical protein
MDTLINHSVDTDVPFDVASTAIEIVLIVILSPFIIGACIYLGVKYIYQYGQQL